MTILSNIDWGGGGGGGGGKGSGKERGSRGV